MSINMNNHDMNDVETHNIIFHHHQHATGGISSSARLLLMPQQQYTHHHHPKPPATIPGSFHSMRTDKAIASNHFVNEVVRSIEKSRIPQQPLPLMAAASGLAATPAKQSGPSLHHHQQQAPQDEIPLVFTTAPMPWTALPQYNVHDDPLLMDHSVITAGVEQSLPQQEQLLQPSPGKHGNGHHQNYYDQHLQEQQYEHHQQQQYTTKGNRSQSPRPRSGHHHSHSPTHGDTHRHPSPSRRSSTPDTHHHGKQRGSQQGQSHNTAVIINLAYTKYRIFHDIANTLGWKISQIRELELKSEPWDIVWIDSGQGIERLIRHMKGYQRINHFPGMVNIYRKDLLAKSMNKMRQLIGKKHYHYTPMTWFVPKEVNDVICYLKNVKHACVIMKPSTGAQGRGIMLATRPEHLLTYHEPYVIQSYLTNPLLIDGFKFDMRIYVLVISCDPLRILLFRNGLCRLCTVPYQLPCDDNLENSFMHLTNYSINKHNQDFIQNNLTASTAMGIGIGIGGAHGQEVPSCSTSGIAGSYHDEYGSKRSIAWLRLWLERQGVAFDPVWREVAHIIVKTILSIAPTLQQNVKNCKIDGQNVNPFTCFEPVLLEVNHMPSFSTDSMLDKSIKTALIAQTLKLLQVSPKERQQYHVNMAIQSQLRLYGDMFNEHDRKIYGTSGSKHPSDHSDKRLRKEKDSDNNSKGKRGSSTKYQFTSRRMYWENYLKHERKYMSNKDAVDRSYYQTKSPYRNHDCYDLIYPVSVYPHQPNTSYESVYQHIMQSLFHDVPNMNQRNQQQQQQQGGERRSNSVESEMEEEEGEDEESDSEQFEDGDSGSSEKEIDQHTNDNKPIGKNKAEVPRQRNNHKGDIHAPLSTVATAGSFHMDSSSQRPQTDIGDSSIKEEMLLTVGDLNPSEKNTERENMMFSEIGWLKESINVEKEELNVFQEMRRATNGIADTLARLGIQPLPFHYQYLHQSSMIDSTSVTVPNTTNIDATVSSPYDKTVSPVDISKKTASNSFNHNQRMLTISNPDRLRIEIEDNSDAGAISARELERYLEREDQIFQNNRQRAQGLGVSKSSPVRTLSISPPSKGYKSSSVDSDMITHNVQSREEVHSEMEIILDGSSIELPLEPVELVQPESIQYRRLMDLKRIAHNVEHDQYNLVPSEGMMDGLSSGYQISYQPLNDQPLHAQSFVAQYNEYKNQYLQSIQHRRQTRSNQK